MGEHKFKKSRASSYKSNRSRSVVTMVIVFLAVLTVIGIDVMQRKQSAPLKEMIPQRSKGPAEAPVKIVEFLDFQCPMCKQGAQVLKEYMLLYPGSIQLTLRYFPLGELNSSMSAYYAECAGAQGKFWDMHDALFETQGQWRTLLKIKPFLNTLAEGMGLDTAALAACVDDNKVRKIVGKEKALGESYFVKSTPSYFVNGELYVGIHSLEDYLKKYFIKQEQSAP